MLDHQDSSGKFERLREQAEDLIRQRPDSSPDSPPDILELIHELRVHQVELEIQNEELQRAQQEISDLHHKFENLYEFAPCGYLTLNTKGIITEANLTAVALLATDKSSLLLSAFSSFILPGWENVFLTARKKAGETGEKQSIELRLKTKDESILWTRADLEADREQDGSVKQWRMVLLDITPKIEAEEKIRRSLDNNKALLKELNHRVKNNMQVILSVINLQSQEIGDEKLKKAMGETQGRIYAMATVHEILHRSDNLYEVDLAQYLPTLSEATMHTYNTRQADIQIKTEIQPINVDLNKSYPLGLAVNELISNAFKYAFPEGRDGEVRIKGEASGKSVRLIVSDNGVGMPVDFDWRKAESLGLQIVRTLIEDQLNGTITLDLARGTKWTMTFPV